MGRRISVMRRRGRVLPSETPRLVDIFGSNLVAHFQADKGITTVGGLVSNWVDQTGNGHDLIQNTAGSRPTYGVNGAANNGPYVSSGTSGAAFMQHTGTPVTVNTGNWSCFIIATTLTNPAVAAVYTTTLTTPGGCVAFAWRRSNLERLEAQQIGLSAPSFVSATGLNMAPTITWNASLTTMDSGGSRTIIAWGEGTTSVANDSHTGSLGIQLAEGYIFRFGGLFYQNLAIQELAFISRTAAQSDADRVRAYVRSRGIST